MISITKADNVARLSSRGEEIISSKEGINFNFDDFKFNVRFGEDQNIIITKTGGNGLDTIVISPIHSNKLSIW